MAKIDSYKSLLIFDPSNYLQEVLPGNSFRVDFKQLLVNKLKPTTIDKFLEHSTHASTNITMISPKLMKQRVLRGYHLSIKSIVQSSQNDKSAPSDSIIFQVGEEVFFSYKCENRLNNISHDRFMIYEIVLRTQEAYESPDNMLGNYLLPFAFGDNFSSESELVMKFDSTEMAYFRSLNADAGYIITANGKAFIGQLAGCVNIKKIDYAKNTVTIIYNYLAVISDFHFFASRCFVNTSMLPQFPMDKLELENDRQKSNSDILKIAERWQKAVVFLNKDNANSFTDFTVSLCNKILTGEHRSTVAELKSRFDIYCNISVQYPEIDFCPDKALDTLNSSHFGFEQAKKEIISCLSAAKNLPGKYKYPIFCLIGPPGVGKTTFAMNIAKALNRKFACLSSSMISTIDDLVGSNAVWVSSQHGRVIEALLEAGSSNPVILFDEIDKLSASGGTRDATAAILALFDPAQNKAFDDNYLRIPVDLSNVFWILSANYRENIPAALRDRLKFIELPAYNTDEKVTIATNYIWPSIQQSFAKLKNITLSDKIARLIIDEYTFEYGVRDLTRHLRSLAERILYAPSVPNKIDEKYIKNNLSDNSLSRLMRKFRSKIRAIPSEWHDRIQNVINNEDNKQQREDSTNRDWCEKILDFPWQCYNTVPPFEQIEATLNKQLIGLDSVARRLSDIFAAEHLGAKKTGGEVLCFLGPPGVGKTTMAQRLAEALNRPLIFHSMSGIENVADIRGVNRFEKNGRPGLIYDSLRQANVANPIIILDEIDKVGNVAILNALIEITDPQQNSRFRDLYIEVPFDISQVIWIFTANDLSCLPRPLLDRLDLIRFYHYTHHEKIEIAKTIIWPKQLSAHNLTDRVHIDMDIFEFMIYETEHTAGIRAMEDIINRICDTLSGQLARCEVEHAVFNLEMANDCFNYTPRIYSNSPDFPLTGVVNGLSVRVMPNKKIGSVDMFEVEAIPGTGKLCFTSNVGDDFRRAATVAYVCVTRNLKSRFPVATYDDIDIYINIFAQASDEHSDGLSCGLAMAVAIASALKNTPLIPLQAFTGAISLRGYITAVGGVCEKIIAARYAGIKKVFIPYSNFDEIDRLSDTVREDIEIIPVKHIEQIWDAIFVEKSE